MDSILKNQVNQIRQNNNDSTNGSKSKSIKPPPLQFKSESNGFFDAFTNGISSLKPPPFQVSSSPIQMKEEEDYGFPTGLLDFDQIDSISNQNDYFPENYMSNETNNSLPTGLLDFDQIDSISNQNDYFPESNESNLPTGLLDFSGNDGEKFSDMGSTFNGSTNPIAYQSPAVRLNNAYKDLVGFMLYRKNMIDGPAWESKNDYGSDKAVYMDNNKFGEWEEDGSKKKGLKLRDEGIFKGEKDVVELLEKIGIEVDEKTKSKLEYEIGTENVGAVLDREAGSLSLSAQATAVGAAISSNNEDMERSDDEFKRFGLSLGEGYGFRNHFGDKDKDNHKEYGIGLDAGIFSVDYKTEDPVKSLIFDQIPMLEHIPINALGDGKSNWTEDLGVDKALDMGIELADDGFDYVNDIDFKKKLNPSNWL